jgi:hypothetical protein
MDPITESRLVPDRTRDLQRTADQVRLERTLRPTSTGLPEAPEPATAVAPRSRGVERAHATGPTTARCAPGEPAV